MKKGFTLTLLLLVAVVLAGAPVSAMAPIVDDFPRIILTDDDSATVGGTYGIDQTFDLDDYIDWYHEEATGVQTKNVGLTAADNFYVYLGGDLLAASYVTPVGAYDGAGAAYTLPTEAEWTALTGASPALPGTADNLYVDSGWGDSRYWLSIDGQALTDQETALVPLAAVVGGSGASETTYTISSFEVTRDDSATESGTAYDETFSADSAGQFAYWYGQPGGSWSGYYVSAGFGSVDIGGYQQMRTSDQGTVSFDAASPTSGRGAGEFGYANWKAQSEDLLVFFIPNNGGPGITKPVFEAKAYLTLSDTSGIDACPGYRLVASNAAGTHQIEVRFTGFGAPVGGLAVPNAPYGGNDFVARLYWATPYETQGMGDTEGMAVWPTNAAKTDALDGRDYGLSWDVFTWPGNAGAFQLKALSIKAYEGVTGDPTSDDLQVASNLKTWASADFANWLNEDFFGQFTAPDGSNLFDHGSGTYVAAGLQLSGFDNAGEAPRMGIQKANPDLSTAGNTISVDPMSLYVVSISANTGTTANAAAAPMLRTDMALQNSAGQARWCNWYETWGAVTAGAGSYKVAGTKESYQVLNPCVPAPGGSVVEQYIWSHLAGTDAGDALTVQVQAFTEGVYNGTWPKTNGYIEFTEVSVDELVAVTTDGRNQPLTSE